MATNLESLIDRAMDMQRRLAEQGATGDASIVEQLVTELTAAQPKAERPYYTVTEAADLIGVSGQTVKNWISRTELDDYRPVAEASRAIEPLPPLDEIVEAMRAGRRRFIWPVDPQEK